MAYTGVYVFGDSLVDAGNALKLANWYGNLTFSDLPEGAPTADKGYFQGRFTNGYTFADLIANKETGLVTKPVFPYGYEDPWIGIPIAPFAGDPSGKTLNFAYGGAQILQGSEAVPDLDGQTDTFKDAVDNRADPNALYIVTIGGNDVRSLAPATGGLPGSPYAALDVAADRLLAELASLVSVGAKNLLITGVPDVGLIPDYDVNNNLRLDPSEEARADLATAFSTYLDTLIRTEVVPALQALGAKVTYVPIAGPAYVTTAGQAIDPALAAVMPILELLHSLAPGTLSADLLNHQSVVFFDQIHPTAQTHALVGSYFYSKLTGTEWVETLPLTGADMNYAMTGAISAAGEVDKLLVSLVGGTTYTLEMLGMASLGTSGSLGDGSLRILMPDGTVVTDFLPKSGNDSGAGFDATFTFTAATTGTYTIELRAVGSLTGTYRVQGGVVDGAADGDTIYTISNAAVGVIEGANGGYDSVRASVSYVLAQGSQVEELTTSDARAKTSINLTGNDHGQAVVGNAGANILDGKGGADTLTGGGGKDVFVLSDTASVDAILDYSRGEIVDVAQVLKVAAGVDAVAAGYLRVTSDGRIQLDSNGGGDGWITLATVNGGGAVTLRYQSGTTLTTVNVARTSATTTALAGAVAAAGLMSSPLAAKGAEGSLEMLAAESGHQDARPHVGDEFAARAERADAVAEMHAAVLGGQAVEPVSGRGDAETVFEVDPRAAQAETAGEQAAPAQAVDTPSHGPPLPVSQTVVMPTAEMLAALAPDADAVQSTAEVARVLADALAGREVGPGTRALGAMLPADAEPAELIAQHFAAALAAPDAVFAPDALAFHPDAIPLV
ncbi:MAG TPA: SGNH/GDSL hydrolase family protein [Sphingomicrobium sp.]|nr:SGNH/GDSL hydrolase family protein [Sphingomicrobium sp.]